MGKFDDLIPQKTSTPSGRSFGDLIPRQAAPSGPTQLGDLPGVSVEDFNRSVQALQGGGTPEQRMRDAKQREYALRRSTQQSYPALVRAGIGFAAKMNNTAVGLGQLAGLTDEAGVARERARYGHIADDTAFQAGGVAGDAALLAAPGSAVTKLATLPQRLAAGAALGGMYGGIQPVVGGESRGANIAINAAGGIGGEFLGEVLKLAGRQLAPQAQTLLRSAQERGIGLTPYQVSDSPIMKRIGRLSETLPFTGARAATQKQADQFTRAVSRTIGENTDSLTPEVFLKASSRIGGVFDDLAARNDLLLTDGLIRKLGAIRQEASDIGDDGTIRAVNSFVDRILRQGESGAMPGQAYQSIDSQIGKAMAAGGEKSLYLGELREALREGMDETISQADKEAWMLARQQYRDLKAIEPLVAKQGLGEGTISPASLMSRVTSDKRGKTQMAKGQRGELGELARIGQRMRTPPSPGTAADLSVMSVLNPLAWGKAAAGIPIGRLLNSDRLARVMASDLRPRIARGAANLGLPVGITASGAASARGKRQKKFEDD